MPDRAAVAEWLRERDDFCIASHLDPDGDSLGSSLALALALDQLGKRSIVVIAQELGRNFAWLPAADRVVTSDRVPEAARAAVLVECSDFDRSGLRGFEGRETLNIDHHAKNRLYADLNWIDPSVAAAGMMIGILIGDLGAEITPTIASLLYVTVLTDTGSFRHSNADAAAMRFAAEMLEAGADAEAIADAVYARLSVGRVRLMADALSSLELHDDARIAVITLTADSFARNAPTTDTEGVINYAQNIDGVVASIFLKEVAPGQVRVSLRSDGSIDVAAVAGAFGGGGHPRAAGFLHEGDREEARHVVLGAIRAALEDTGTSDGHD